MNELLELVFDALAFELVVQHPALSQQVIDAFVAALN